MKMDRDDWLSDLFGHDVFRVTLSLQPTTVPIADLRTELCRVLRPSAAFIYAKVPTRDVSCVHVLEALGFHVVDVNVTFERESSLLPVEVVRVRDARPADYDALLNIAASSFVYSRFHLDPCISRHLADEIKRAWILSYTARQRGEKLLVAEVDGRPAGFLAVLATHDQKLRVIDLIGVDRLLQGRGIGRALVSHFIRDSVGRYPLLRVGTQVANVPSVQLYEGCGFRLSESVYVLHAHFMDGKIL